MHSPGINGEGESRGPPAWFTWKMAVKTECVCVPVFLHLFYWLISVWFYFLVYFSVLYSRYLRWIKTANANSSSSNVVAWLLHSDYVWSTCCSVWIQVTRTGEDIGQFTAGPINKAVPSFRNSLTRVHEGWRKTFWAFFSTEKMFTLSWVEFTPVVFVVSWMRNF